VTYPNTLQYHPFLSIDVHLPRINNNLNCEISYRNFAARYYTLLYNILSLRDWLDVYGTSAVDVAVPVSMLLSEVPWSRQFLVAITANPNAIPRSPIP
jgi:hypothetical protein